MAVDTAGWLTTGIVGAPILGAVAAPDRRSPDTSTTGDRAERPAAGPPVRLTAGAPAPDFTLPDSGGRPVTLSALRGRRVVLYAYPAAMTPGCTTEACDFRDSLSALSAAGVTVLGISPDGPSRLAEFAARDGLTFPLLADESTAVLTAYGAYGEKNSYGRTVVGVRRSTFVVDADGLLEKVFYDVKATGHVARLRAELGV